MTISNAQKNTISNIIRDVMDNVTSEGNRSAELVLALYQNDVTYAPEVIQTVFNLKGADRTEKIDTMLKDASDTFVEIVAQADALAEMKKEKKATNNDLLKLDAVRNKIRAARIMFERSLAAVFYLRSDKSILKVQRNRVGAGVIKIYRPDPEIEDEEEAKADPVFETLSVRELTKNGNALLKPTNSKSKSTDKTKNPQADVLADASRSLANVLSHLSKEGKRKPITDYVDAIESDMEVILKELFAAKFMHDGILERKAALDWMTETFAKPATTNAKQTDQKKTGTNG